MTRRVVAASIVVMMTITLLAGACTRSSSELSTSSPAESSGSTTTSPSTSSSSTTAAPQTTTAPSLAPGAASNSSSPTTAAVRTARDILVFFVAEAPVGASGCGEADPYEIGVKDAATNTTLGTAAGTYSPGGRNCSGTARLQNIAPATEYGFFFLQQGRQIDLGRILSANIARDSVIVRFSNNGVVTIS